MEQIAPHAAHGTPSPLPSSETNEAAAKDIHIAGKFENLPQIKALRDLVSRSGQNNPQTSFTNELLRQYKHSLKLHTPDLNDNNVEFEFVIENQRGMKFLGIPLFSTKSLIPLVDPPSFQLLSGKSILEGVRNVENAHTSLVDLYPLPDLNWEWTWDTWYVFMLHDVDDQGWVYLSIWFGSKQWKGKCYFGNFIRRRIWIRLRNRKGYDVIGYQTDHIKGLVPIGHDSTEDLDAEEYEDGATLIVGRS